VLRCFSDKQRLILNKEFRAVDGVNGIYCLGTTVIYGLDLREYGEELKKKAYSIE